jgi:hypothetical protein
MTNTKNLPPGNLQRPLSVTTNTTRHGASRVRKPTEKAEAASKEVRPPRKVTARTEIGLQRMAHDAEDDEEDVEDPEDDHEDVDGGDDEGIDEGNENEDGEEDQDGDDEEVIYPPRKTKPNNPSSGKSKSRSSVTTNTQALRVGGHRSRKPTEKVQHQSKFCLTCRLYFDASILII